MAQGQAVNSRDLRYRCFAYCANVFLIDCDPSPRNSSCSSDWYEQPIKWGQRGFYENAVDPHSSCPCWGTDSWWCFNNQQRGDISCDGLDYVGSNLLLITQNDWLINFLMNFLMNISANFQKIAANICNLSANFLEIFSKIRIIALPRISVNFWMKSTKHPVNFEMM